MGRPRTNCSAVKRLNSSAVVPIMTGTLAARRCAAPVNGSTGSDVVPVTGPLSCSVPMRS